MRLDVESIVEIKSSNLQLDSKEIRGSKINSILMIFNLKNKWNYRVKVDFK